MTLYKIYIYDYECENLLINFNIKKINIFKASLNSDYNLFWEEDTIGKIAFYNTKSKLKENIQAHKHAIQDIAVNSDGLYLATCSNNGTLIRIYSTINKYLIGEYKRGVDNCNIVQIYFGINNNNFYLITSKGSLHYFDFQKYYLLNNSNPKKENDKLMFNKIKSIGVLKIDNFNTIYFNSNFINNDSEIFYISASTDWYLFKINLAKAREEMITLAKKNRIII